jgi:hypothetical protein
MGVQEHFTVRCEQLCINALKLITFLLSPYGLIGAPQNVQNSTFHSLEYMGRQSSIHILWGRIIRSIYILF